MRTFEISTAEEFENAKREHVEGDLFSIDPDGELDVGLIDFNGIKAAITMNKKAKDARSQPAVSGDSEARISIANSD